MEKEELFAKRKRFFEDIIENLFIPPSEIDFALEQDKYYVEPDRSSLIMNERTGHLAIKVPGNFFDIDFFVLYSIWQVGSRLKIGVNLKESIILPAFAEDEHGEVFRIFGEENPPTVDALHGGIFYDWEFPARELYSSYMNQENIISGVRHLHFRTMRIIYDYLEKINNS